jgi:hypothetical protein
VTAWKAALKLKTGMFRLVKLSQAISLHPASDLMARMASPTGKLILCKHKQGHLILSQVPCSDCAAVASPSLQGYVCLIHGLPVTYAGSQLGLHGLRGSQTYTLWYHTWMGLVWR